MSDFVNIEDHINQIGKNESWAEDDDDTQNDKPTFNWQKPQEVTKTMSIAEIAEEEEKKRKLEAAKPKKQPPPKSNNAPSSTYSSSTRYDNYNKDRPPRNNQPSEPRELPTQPPYTAFVGNLPFETTEDEIRNFFTEVKSVRLIKDPSTGKGKGYGYVEFESLDALSRALQMKSETFQDRPVNVDIAKPQSNESRKPTWGSSGNSFGDKNRNTNTQWGPSDRNTSSFGERRNNRPSFDRTPQQSSQPPAKKTPGEDPFGSAIIDTKRLNEQATLRLKKELERDEEKKKKLEEAKNKNEKERNEKKSQTSTTTTTQTASWRNQGNKPPVSPRSNDGKYPSFAKSPRTSNTHSNANSNYQSSDNDGFRSGGGQKNRPYEASGIGSAARASEAHANAKQTRTIIKKEEPQKNEEKKSTKNPYALLGEEDLN